MGEEGSMQACFDRARQEAPCVLILEDLDSLVRRKHVVSVSMSLISLRRSTTETARSS
jgi:SpoVK/Ycf46/Vps4 family AAA+-type ATPase